MAVMTEHDDNKDSTFDAIKESHRRSPQVETENCLKALIPCTWRITGFART
jgi:hypothetical protein